MNKRLEQLSVGTLFKIPADSRIRGISPRTERTVDPSFLYSYEVVAINSNSSGTMTSIRIKSCMDDSILRIEKQHLHKMVDVVGKDASVNSVNEPEKPTSSQPAIFAGDLNVDDIFELVRDTLSDDEDNKPVWLKPETEYIIVDEESRYMKIADAVDYSDWCDYQDNGDLDDEEPDEPEYYFIPKSTEVIKVSDEQETKPRLDESTAGSVELGQSFNDFTIQVESMISKQVAALTAAAFDKALVDSIQREVNFVGSAPAEFRMNLHPNTYQQNDSFYINLFKNMADVDDRRRGCIRDANALVLTYAEFRQIVNLVLVEKKKAGEKQEITLLPKREDEVENMQLTALEHFMFLKMNNRGVDEVATTILWNLVPQDKPVLSIGL